MNRLVTTPRTTTGNSTLRWRRPNSGEAQHGGSSASL